MSDTIMKELTEAVHYAYRLGYVSADRAHEMQLIIESIVDERDIAKADVEKIVTYNTRLQDALDQARAEVERLTKERDEACAELERLKRQEVKITFLGKPSSSGGGGGRSTYHHGTEVVHQCVFCSAEFNPIETVTCAECHGKEIQHLKRELEQAIAKINGQKDALLEAARQVTDAAFQQAEVEQLKQALHDARLENSAQAAQLEQATVKQSLTVRPEPSRLEIAAMLKAAWLSNADYKSEDRCDEGWWIEQADALIEAAKGGTK